MVDSVDAALRLRQALRDAGQNVRWVFLAELAIPADVEAQPSLWEGHWTVWARAEELLGHVVRVMRVE